MADDGELPGNDASNLTEEQHSKLIQYQEVTGSEDLESAREKLIHFNWNLELAVHDTLNESEGTGLSFHQPEPDYNVLSGLTAAAERITDSSPIARRPINTLVDTRRESWTQWLINFVLIPYRFTFNVVGDLFKFIARLVWPSFGRYSGDPLQDVLDFKTKFDDEYGTEHPTFYQGLYSQALSDAKRELKFLLVYLHSPSHQDTDKFCREVLCNSGFKEYVNGNMLFWACDVDTHEGYRVSKAVRETTYPFLAVVCLRDNRMTIVWRVEGFMPLDELIALFARIIDENEPAIVAARAEREERSMSQTLRAEQDRAYQIALEKDREKAKRKKELEDVKIMEENLRKNKELEKERKLQCIADTKAECRRQMEETPEPGLSDSSAVQIRIKLPSGSTFARRFSTLDKFQALADFVYGIEETPTDFALNSNFPRKTFQPDENRESSLADIGITSSTILFVQDLNDDSSDED